MAVYTFTLKDKQTGKIQYVKIEAKTRQEAKQIALRDYGVAFEVR